MAWEGFYGEGAYYVSYLWDGNENHRIGWYQYLKWAEEWDLGEYLNLLETALKAAEWTSHSAMLADDGPHCGVCYSMQFEGHEPDCVVGKALSH